MTEKNAAAHTAPATQPNVDGDYLGYGYYADSLWTRILAAVNKDAAQLDATDPTKRNKPPGDDPLVVGIFGEWGAGKSRLLSMVYDKAAAHQKTQQANRGNDMGFELTVPVFFQPWKYEHEPHLHVPLVMHITYALKAALQREAGILEAMKSAGNAVAAVSSKAGVMAHTAASIASKVYTPLKTLVGSISVFGTNIRLPDELGEWLEDAADATSDMPEAAERRKTKQADKAQENDKRLIRHTPDGLYFYRIQEFLLKLTRPGRDDGSKKAAGDANVTPSTRINFVIFIDDLDRCLPEKAVETLELIKTVFSLESFAFVLALDEEVVERGISHRYRDYTLKDKKPEMPITGFEYLEKIVHLPFRLPALSAGQALYFMEKYERDVVLAARQAVDAESAARNAWFVERRHESNGTPAESSLRTAIRSAMAEVFGDSTQALRLHLGKLVIGSFDAYVPRKLIRVIELFHQILDVLDKQDKPVDLNGGIDPRLLLAFMLLQLFHPDLYRTLRRSGVGFDVLRDAFDIAKCKEKDEIPLTAAMSDIDLLHWAVYQGKGVAGGHAAPVSVEKAVELIGLLPAASGQRHPAQRIRLPIVERLLGHRAAQRHVFDALKLFDALQQTQSTLALPTTATRAYFSIIANATHDGLADSLAVLVNVTPPPPLASDPRPRAEGVSASSLFDALISAEPREQQGAAKAVGLQQGTVLGDADAQALLTRCETWLNAANDAEKPALAKRMLTGLQHVAEYIPRTIGEKFWALVQGVEHGGDLGKAIESIEQLQARELWADVRSTLGADPRFDSNNWYLPKGKATNDEPIPGFVQVAYDPNFKLTDESRQDTVDKAPFYLARTLTTVDQYAAFIADGGYQQKAYWDGQGLAWLSGDWDKAIAQSDKELAKRLASRPVAERIEPARWNQQQANGSRGVWGLNWFEARAYARWLDGKLQPTIEAKFPNQTYHVMLPIEAQWERAARAENTAAADAREWPWAGGADQAHLRANIDVSKIGRSSVVGIFEDSPIGFADMAGNLWEWQDNLVVDLWEWQDNLVVKQGAYEPWKRLERMPVLQGGDTSNWLKVTGDWKTTEHPAMRGGSWNSTTDFARCSFRNGYLPDDGLNYVGFRVVLSLA